MRPVLEDPALAQEPRDRALRVVADPRRERQPVRAADGRDRVELHAAEPVDGRGDVGGTRPAEPRRVALVGNDVPPELCDGDRLHGLVVHGDVPGHRGDAVDPRLHVRVLREVELALVGDVRVAVDRDVGRRVARRRRASRGRRRGGRRGSRAPGCRRATSRRADPGTCSFAPISAIQNRAVAIAGSSSYCSKNIHCRTRARSSGDSGRYSEPSARYQRIAFDSARHSPSSSSSVGTRSAGFLPPRISGRFERSNTSSSTRSYSMPRWARICRAFQQFPESWLL